MPPTLAIVAGASGLTGRQLMQVLGEDPHYTQVRALLRQDNLATLHAGQIPGATHIFCCLGTTIAKAGSRQAFREVDFDYVVRLARAGREAGAASMVVVSSVGAGPASRNFYLRVKGEMEQALASIGFDALHIFRPSLLMGHREEPRRGEEFGLRLARALGWMLAGSLSKYRPVPVRLLAEAMAAAGRSALRGCHVHHYDEIVRLAGKSRP